MPFTSQPSTVVRDDPRARAIAAADREQGSADTLIRALATIQRLCPECSALPSYRCLRLDVEFRAYLPATSPFHASR